MLAQGASVVSTHNMDVIAELRTACAMKQAEVHGMVDSLAHRRVFTAHHRIVCTRLKSLSGNWNSVPAPEITKVILNFLLPVPIPFQWLGMPDFDAAEGDPILATDPNHYFHAHVPQELLISSLTNTVAYEVRLQVKSESLTIELNHLYWLFNNEKPLFDFLLFLKQKLEESLSVAL